MNRTTSSMWVKGMVNLFGSLGLDVARLFHAAQLDLNAVNDADARFNVDKVSELWELAVAWSGNPSLGLDLTLAARYVNFDIVGYAMLSSPDLRTAFQNLARYMALISDATVFTLVPEQDHSWLVIEHVGNARPIPRQRQEYAMLTVLILCRWLTRRELHPMAADFAFPDPVNVLPYQNSFGCTLRFNQPVTRFLLSGSDLAMALPSHSAQMLQLHEQLIEQRLISLGNASTSYLVSKEIILRLHQGEPRREAVARCLAMSDRTLQRRLLAEKTSFQQLMDEARSELARKYLADNRYSLAQVADMLGFVDQSNFFRACKRWLGMPPGQFRQAAVCSAGHK